MSSDTEIKDILKNHEASLLRYALRLLNDTDKAKQAVQETLRDFVRYSRGKNGPQILSNPEPWLYKNLRVTCVKQCVDANDEFNINLKKDEFTDSPQKEEEVSDQQQTPDKEINLVREHINMLEPKIREVVILKLEHDRNYREIADIMSVTVNNVGEMLHEAINTISSGLKNG